MPLAIARITTIKAARAGLQGQVHALTHVGGVTIYASEDFSYESDDETFPLANSLLLLDLTGNNVTHMPRLPLAPGSRRFLLRDIDKLHLGPTVLSQALKEGTILDLSGTTVVNKDEAKRLLQEDVLKITDDHAFRDTHGGFVCKNLLGFNIFVKSLLQKLLALQGPVLLQMAQLWGVLSRLGRRGSRQGLREIPYMEALQLTATEVQNSLNLQCSFDAEMVRTMTALSSPLTPLLLRPGKLWWFLAVNMALRTLTLLFIGGASSTAELLSCQAEDGDGESLEDFAFRKAFRHLRCSDHDGVAFWIDAVGCGCAVAYGVLIPYFALREARLCYAHVEEEPRRTTLQINTLRGQLAKEVLPGRLLAAAAAHLAVHCRGRRHVQLQEEYVIITSEGPVEKAEELDAMKLVADDDTSRDLDTLRSRKIAEMLTERTMVAESSDRWLQGAQPLLFKYAVAQDIWTDVLMKLYAVALVSCVSMMDAWKWAVAFSLGVAVLVGVYQPYMQPQVSHLQSLSCFALAVTSVAFVYDLRWLARVALLSPVLLLLWQAPPMNSFLSHGQ
ncbi:Uncharacterized protein SCF082_LOCUS18369 [Durusdinium trenchii]|uniref:Uncharacterized protein n=1 Tax=Durusdinium trenchii TaxID=1381693 RepID=A0ABP0KPD2_9DINO